MARTVLPDPLAPGTSHPDSPCFQLALLDTVRYNFDIGIHIIRVRERCSRESGCLDEQITGFSLKAREVAVAAKAYRKRRPPFWARLALQFYTLTVVEALSPWYMFV